MNHTDERTIDPPVWLRTRREVASRTSDGSDGHREISEANAAACACTERDSREGDPIAGLSALKIATVYEDFASGSRAKRFAECLAERLGCTAHLSQSIWRSDLFEFWPIADAATRAASDCDYLIVSLRGNRVLPLPARQWIETQLDGAGQRGGGLIVLSDYSQGRSRVVEGTGLYLRCACLARSVAYFSHVVAPPPKVATTRSRNGEETSEPALFQQRWVPALQEHAS